MISLAGKQNGIGTAMHNAGYEALGVNFVYIPIATDDIKNAIAGIRALNIVGSSVSMPHKQAVMQHLDKIDEVAKKIGAVNTIVNDSGVLTGYNSDWLGAMAALQEVTELEGKKVVIIGAGGAARAIVYGLTQSKAKAVVYDRTLEKAKELAESFNTEVGGDLEALKSVDSYDIVINATSVGFGTDESVVSKDFFKPNAVVMDVVLVPTETTFLKQAKAKGSKTVAGHRMLIHQALFQMEKYTGKKAPFETMEKALLEVLDNSHP